MRTDHPLPTYKSVALFGPHEDRVIETVGYTHDEKAFEVGYYNGGEKPKAIINISTAVGCPVGCNFCELTEAGRNLTPGEMVHQVKIMGRLTARYDGFNPFTQPLKVNFAKTGEPVFNPAMVRTMEDIAENFSGVSFKYSTSAPNAAFLKARILEVARFAHEYKAGTVQLTLSLISTNEEFRRKSAKAGLAPLPRVREIIEAWRNANPDGRIPNCSLLVGDGTPCNPDEIKDILPSGLANFRIRAIVPNEHTQLVGIQKAGENKIESIVARFRDAGYDISTAGIPTNTESTFGLASNVTRLKMLRGEFDPGIWDVSPEKKLLMGTPTYLGALTANF